MKSNLLLRQTTTATISWWVEVYVPATRQSYCLGPFISRAEAKVSRGAHVATLCNSEVRDLVALIKQR